MRHLDRKTLSRFYDSDLEEEGVERVLQHLSSCQECEELAEDIWSKIEPSMPGSSVDDPSSTASQKRRDQIREAALKELRFGQLLKDSIDFFTHGLARLLGVFLAPLKHAFEEPSEPDDRRKNP